MDDLTPVVNADEKVPLKSQEKILQDALTAAAGVSMTLMVLVVALVSVFFSVLNGIFPPTIPLLPYAFFGLSLFEVGMALFLLHSCYLLPTQTPIRYAPAGLTAFFVSFQIAFGSEGWGLMFILPWLCGITIVGGFLQRITGAAFSHMGAEVVQRPLGIRDIMAIAPLLLIMGIVPSLMNLRWTPVSSSGFASNIIYYAAGLFVGSLMPLGFCYFWLSLMRASEKTCSIVAVVVFVLIAVLAVSEVPLSGSAVPYVTFSIVGMFVCISAGFLIAYMPFHHNGFRLVWAKRQLPPVVSTDISFDDIDA